MHGGCSYSVNAWEIIISLYIMEMNERSSRMMSYFSDDSEMKNTPSEMNIHVG